MGDPLAAPVSPGPHMVQYGNTHDVPLLTPIDKAIVAGLHWAITDFILTMESLGIPPVAVLDRLQTYFVPAVQRGIGHSDPLHQLVRPGDAIVNPNHIFGWKVAVFVVGDEPGEPLVEGSPLGR